MSNSNRSQPIRFYHRGEVVEIQGPHTTRSVLEWLREDAHCTGTKEGCNEGDCGACTVVIAELAQDGAKDAVGGLQLQTVNACIQFLPSLNGKALFTVEDIKGQCAGKSACASKHADAGLHPVQQAMVDCHGSQCGFCTPGFVMSLWSTYEQHQQRGTQPTRQQLADELSGNLCRCTGYRPILDAAQHMATLPAMAVNEPQLLQKLELLALTSKGLEANFSYISPTTLPALLAARAAHPHAQVVAGCTDVGLWITKLHKQYAQILDVTRVAALRTVDTTPQHIRIGAAVTLTDAFAALTAQWPQLHRFATRFAGLPVRNAGTLGGNVANGSPIGDSMPLLIALRAQVVLASTRGERTLALEDLYTGYRQNAMAPDELLVHILVPRPADTERLAVYKVSKRFDDDISAVCLALNLDIAGGVVQRARIGAGGVAATPARARQAEAALQGQPWTEATVQRAALALQAELSPISDMRASGAYRSAVLGNLLQRYWLESQGQQAASLEDLDLESVA